MPDERARLIGLGEWELAGGLVWCAADVDEFLVLRDAPPYAGWRASVAGGDHDRAEVVGHFSFIAEEGSADADVLEELHVAPAWRRLGIANAVMRHLQAAHDRLGRDLLVLPGQLAHAEPALPVAEIEAWYVRLGFTERSDHAYLVHAARPERASADLFARLAARRAARLAAAG